MTRGAREAEYYREDSELPLLKVLVMETGQLFRLNKIAGEDGFSLEAKEKLNIQMKCQIKVTFNSSPLETNAFLMVGMDY